MNVARPHALSRLPARIHLDPCPLIEAVVDLDEPVDGEAVEVGVADAGDVGLGHPGQAGRLDSAQVALPQNGR